MNLFFSVFTVRLSLRSFVARSLQGGSQTNGWPGVTDLLAPDFIRNLEQTPVFPYLSWLLTQQNSIYTVVHHCANLFGPSLPTTPIMGEWLTTTNLHKCYSLNLKEQKFSSPHFQYLSNCTRDHKLYLYVVPTKPFKFQKICYNLNQVCTCTQTHIHISPSLWLPLPLGQVYNLENKVPNSVTHQTARK